MNYILNLFFFYVIDSDKDVNFRNPDVLNRNCSNSDTDDEVEIYTLTKKRQKSCLHLTSEMKLQLSLRGLKQDMIIEK